MTETLVKTSKPTKDQGSDSTVQAVMLNTAKVKTSPSGECNGGHPESKSQTEREAQHYKQGPSYRTTVDQLDTNKLFEQDSCPFHSL